VLYCNSYKLNNGAFGMYSGLRNPLKLMSYVTPLMAIATALLSLVFFF
jgi:hypothetical protein